ncbi:hypothetical protein F2P56_000764 [Juglans regia]|uniref:Benzyl alcohol O-benzoyltransferase-like n=2 Tax=Juglans regia TaxID=51240 RepID=A0A2I4EB42_JUGRE|nr:benzyl alcohol O-benzoyltransferase-like [Juglans regia]KAF5479984.1 hypothetical protein F2P56_000764 [Juglans regia]
MELNWPKAHNPCLSYRDCDHCICDAYGAYQFITAVSEFSKDPNRSAPSTLPSWEQEILRPRSPPIISYPHHEYDESDNPITYSVSSFRSLAQTSIFLSRADISALKNKTTGSKCATFDAVTSCLRRARTRTLINPKSNARLIFPIDTRFRYKSLPNGYYGATVVFPCAITKAAKLVKEPLYYAAKLISEVKKDVGGDDYRASVLDFIESNGRRGFYSEEAFVVSDMRCLRFNDVDFGWRRGVYGGPARAGTGMVPGMVTSVIGHKNEEGVEGVLALISLPPESLERLHKERRTALLELEAKPEKEPDEQRETEADLERKQKEQPEMKPGAEKDSNREMLYASRRTR